LACALMDDRQPPPLAVVVIGRDPGSRRHRVVRASADFLEHPFSDRRLRSVIRRAIGEAPGVSWRHIGETGASLQTGHRCFYESNTCSHQ
jgi:hypothetical protein